MKPRFRAYRRDDRDGMYYYKDSVTGERESLETKDPEEAERLVGHMNETLKNPHMNHQIGMTYLSAADPQYASRTWGYVMDHIIAEIENTPPTVDGFENFRQIWGPIHESVATPINDGAENFAIGVPAAIGVPCCRILDDKEWSTGICACRPRKRLRHDEAPEDFRGQAIFAKQGRATHQLIKAFLIAENIKRPFLDGDQWTFTSPAGEKILQLLEVGHRDKYARRGKET